jgi:hypothetical protein
MKLKKKLKKTQKTHDLSQPNLTDQNRDPSHEAEITSNKAK